MARSRVLILGGTGEASALCQMLAAQDSVVPILSLAGRTRAPVLPPVPCRIGGFGGIEGLAAYLRAEAIALLVDATHPFARQMSRNAVAAAQAAGVPLLALRRPPWVAQPGDDWRHVADMPAAAAAIGPVPRRVFLTIGRQEIAPFAAYPQHDYLIRSVDPPDPASLPPRATVLTARGPFGLGEERTLLQTQRIDVLVSKNAGGDAMGKKLDAARRLGLPVIMVARPLLPPCETVPDVAGALAWLAAHAGLPRGA